MTPRLPAGCRKYADVAQLVEHHLAKVRVAGSNPVVRSEVPRPVGGSVRWSGREARQRPAQLSTRVQIPSPPLRRSHALEQSARLVSPTTCEMYGRLAQWESASLTRKRSLVQSQYRPPAKSLVPQGVSSFRKQSALKACPWATPVDPIRARPTLTLRPGLRRGEKLGTRCSSLTQIGRAHV